MTFRAYNVAYDSGCVKLNKIDPVVFFVFKLFGSTVQEHTYVRKSLQTTVFRLDGYTAQTWTLLTINIGYSVVT